MAVKPETTFYSSVHRHLPPPSELYRMKNSNEYVAGVPDFWYDGLRDLWVEYKFLVLPKRPTTMLDFTDIKKDYSLSSLQRDWIKDRVANGREVWVVVGCDAGGVVFKDCAWLTPLSTLDFINLVQPRAHVAQAIANFVLGNAAHELSTALHDSASRNSRVPHRQHRRAALLSGPSTERAETLPASEPTKRDRERVR